MQTMECLPSMRHLLFKGDGNGQQDRIGRGLSREAVSDSIATGRMNSAACYSGSTGQ